MKRKREMSNDPKSQQKMPETGGATVTVACKLPAGLVLQLYAMKETKEPLMGGGYHAVRRAEPVPGATVTVHGNAHPQNAAPAATLVGGYALTPDVPKAFWDQWLAANKDSMMVRNHLIFAQPSEREARAEARDKSDVASNLERLDPEKLPKGLEKSDLMKKAA
jgi:hypothetical protein